MEQLKSHPEWRELMRRIEPLIQIDRVFGFDELADLLTLDVRSDRGRAQWHRFQKEALRTWNVAFESVRTVGYRVVAAGEHARLARRQMRLSGRRLWKGLAIATHCNVAELNDAERRANADITARLARQVTNHRKELNESRPALQAAQYKPLPKPALA